MKNSYLFILSSVFLFELCLGMEFHDKNKTFPLERAHHDKGVEEVSKIISKFFSNKGSSLKKKNISFLSHLIMLSSALQQGCPIHIGNTTCRPVLRMTQESMPFFIPLCTKKFSLDQTPTLEEHISYLAAYLAPFLKIDPLGEPVLNQELRDHYNLSYNPVGAMLSLPHQENTFYSLFSHLFKRIYDLAKQDHYKIEIILKKSICHFLNNPRFFIKYDKASVPHNETENALFIPLNCMDISDPTSPLGFLTHGAWTFTPELNRTPLKEQNKIKFLNAFCRSFLVLPHISFKKQRYLPFLIEIDPYACPLLPHESILRFPACNSSFIEIYQTGKKLLKTNKEKKEKLLINHSKNKIPEFVLIIQWALHLENLIKKNILGSLHKKNKMQKDIEKVITEKVQDLKSYLAHAIEEDFSLCILEPFLSNSFYSSLEKAIKDFSLHSDNKIYFSLQSTLLTILKEIHKTIQELRTKHDFLYYSELNEVLNMIPQNPQWWFQQIHDTKNSHIPSSSDMKTLKSDKNSASDSFPKEIKEINKVNNQQGNSLLKEMEAVNFFDLIKQIHQGDQNNNISFLADNIQVMFTLGHKNTKKFLQEVIDLKIKLKNQNSTYVEEIKKKKEAFLQPNQQIKNVEKIKQERKEQKLLKEKKTPPEEEKKENSSLENSINETDQNIEELKRLKQKTDLLISACNKIFLSHDQQDKNKRAEKKKYFKINDTISLEIGVTFRIIDI